MLRLHVIASGSKGNAAIVEDADSGACLLVDCGVCAREFFAGCETSGIDVSRLRALLVTHEHTDHTKGLGVVLRGLRKRGIELPVYANPATKAASPELTALTDAFAFEDMAPGIPLAFDGIEVVPFRTSHDAASSCGFRFEAGADALGYLTDSGVVTPEAHDALTRVRILALEANHDPHMLAVGPYPAWLKERVGGEFGHLSNYQAADELDRLRWSGLEQVIAMHISENNNTYLLPPAVLQEAVDAETVQVRSAFQHRPVSVE